MNRNQPNEKPWAGPTESAKGAVDVPPRDPQPPATDTGRDPAETEPTTNSTGAAPDQNRVLEAEDEAAAREAH